MSDSGPRAEVPADRAGARQGEAGGADVPAGTALAAGSATADTTAGPVGADDSAASDTDLFAGGRWQGRWRGGGRPRSVGRLADWLGEVERPAVPSARFQYRDDEAIERPFNAAQLRRLLAYVRPYRRRVSAAIAVTVTGALAQLAVPYLLDLAVNRALLGHNLALLDRLAAAIALLYTLFWATTVARTRLMARVGQAVLADLRRALYDNLQGLSLDFFEGRPVGQVLVRVTSDVNALSRLFTAGIINTLTDSLTVVGIVIVMLALAWKLALLIFITLPGMVLLSTRMRRRVRRGWQLVRRRVSGINAHLGEAVQGVRVTQAFRQEEENRLFFGGLTFANFEAWMAAVRYSSLFRPLVELTGACGTCILFYEGSMEARAGAITVGLLVAFTQYVNQFWQPISRLGETYNTLLQAMASSERIFQYLDYRPRVVDAPDGRVLPPLRGEVRFDGVSFAYPPRHGSEPVSPGSAPATPPPAQAPAPGGHDRVDQPQPRAATAAEIAAAAAPAGAARAAGTAADTSADPERAPDDGRALALQGVSFQVAPGQTLALVGHTGAGKTSVVSLLARFYDPTAGRILLDGHDLREVRVRSLRSQMAVVLQEPFLFSETVRENIRYGRLGATDAEVETAARAVCAHDFIVRLPEGYETEVRERGGRLSAGQRQLVALARALLADPRILLLDEATSSIDTGTERLVQQALARLLHGRTAVVIAHRLSTVRSADRILVLDGGRIAEAGSHMELVARDGLYAEFLRTQFGLGDGGGDADGRDDGGDGDGRADGRDRGGGGDDGGDGGDGRDDGGLGAGHGNGPRRRDRRDGGRADGRDTGRDRGGDSRDG